ncbi:hypothetical protein ACFX2C_000398 [Malus domestica]
MQLCLKDEFPLSNIDIMIDSILRQGLMSFMDGFSGYNQIKMSGKDVENMAFRMQFGNFYYTVMPFRLKKACATYQRAMMVGFHNMMGKEVEDYVDNLVMKSKTREGHWEVLRKVLRRCRAYVLKMNPKKCAFGVSSGKFLGFLVHQCDIDVYPNKKGNEFVWTKECSETYQRAQKLVTNLPTMKAPILGILLKLYLATTTAAPLFPSPQATHYEEESTISKEVFDALLEIAATAVKKEPWVMHFDGSSTITGEGAGVALANPEGQVTALFFKLSFPCTNNVAEYEAFTIGPSTAREMGARKI